MQRKITITLLLFLALAGCGTIPIYKPAVQQGNIIDEELVNKLQPGMTKGQVIYIMGTPLLEESFAPERFDYVYTFKPKKGELEEKRVTLHFMGNKLDSVSGIYDSTKTATTQLPVPLESN